MELETFRHSRPALPALTGLRFVAALCVFVSHAIPVIVPFPDPPVFVVILSSLSAIGMSLFFVLSGFVIYYNYADTIDSPAGIYNFFVARFARLYPLYFIFLCYDWLQTVPHAKIAPAPVTIPLYLSLTQSWLYLPENGRGLMFQFGNIPTVSWSISTEWFFYIVFPVACLALSRLTTARAAAATCALVVMTVSMLLVLNRHAPEIAQFGVRAFGPIGADPNEGLYRWLTNFSPYIRIFEFLLGCATAFLYLRLPRPPSIGESRLGLGSAVAAIAAIAALQCLIFGQIDAAWFRPLAELRFNYIFAPFLAGLIFCCARYRNFITRTLETRTLVLCGEVSFSIYLLHLEMIMAFRHEASPVVSWHAAFVDSARLVVVLLTTIGLSFVTWSIIEMPARRWIRRAMGRQSSLKGRSAADGPVKSATSPSLLNS